MARLGMAILCLKFWQALRRRRRRRVRLRAPTRSGSWYCMLRRGMGRGCGGWGGVRGVAPLPRSFPRRMGGVAVTLTDAENFPAVKDASDAAWREALAQVRRIHEDLVKTVAALPDSRLDEVVPGKEGAHYTLYYMLHGVVQHELYHAGQIALLKKM